ncbi:Ig-like domain-containing protein, partial [Duganella sp. S19_KUP01_CR8]|uniref:Ig-like domain-containing protein n=1 Tax=Duganella sp. S19_KUP01_CR8 TaxID=3025502 RepID=UPI002FCDACF2
MINTHQVTAIDLVSILLASIYRIFSKAIRCWCLSGVLLVCGLLTVNQAQAVFDGSDAGGPAIFQNVPTTMVAGQRYHFQVNMKNLSGTWENNRVFLVPLNPADAAVWGVAAIPISGSAEPNTSGTFIFDIVAPSVPGNYNFQWRLARGNILFGKPMDNIVVQVVAPTKTTVEMTAPVDLGFGNAYRAPSEYFAVRVAGRILTAPGVSIAKVEVLDGTKVMPPVTPSLASNVDLYVIYTSGSHKVRLRVTDSLGAVVLSSETSIFCANASVYPVYARMNSPIDSTVYSVNPGEKALVPVVGVGATDAGYVNTLALYDADAQIQIFLGDQVNRNIKLGVGKHTLRLRAYDGLGNPGPFSDPVTVTVTEKNSAPVVQIIQPSATNSVRTAAPGAKASVTLLGVAEDPDGGTVAKLELLDFENVVATVVGNQIDSPVALPLGAHALRLRATDKAGAVGYSEIRNLAVLSESHPVTFMQLSLTSNGGAVNAGEKFEAGILAQMYANVFALPTYESVRLIELREGTSILASKTYPTRYDSDGDIQNDVRYLTLTSKFAIGVHQIFLRTYTQTTVADTPVFTVTVVEKNHPPTVTLTSPSAGTYFAQPDLPYANVPIIAAASDSDGSVVLLELLEGETVVAQSNGASINDNGSFAVGSHTVRLRATDNSGEASYGPYVTFEVRQGNVIGGVTEVRTDNNGHIQVVGWACEDTKNQGLNVQVLGYSPGSAIVFGSGVANVATEPDSASVKAKCHTPGAAHNFVVDMPSPTSGDGGVALYVKAQPADGSAGQLLPCLADSCRSPGMMQIVLLSPVDGVAYPSTPSKVTIRAKILNGGEIYDGVDVNLDGGWGPLVKDADGTYVLTASFDPATTHTVYARVRKGNITLNSTRAQIYMGNVLPAKVTLSATPANLRVTGSDAPFITFAGHSTDPGRTVSKLELIKLSNGSYSDTQVASSAGTNSSLDLNTALPFSTGIYRFKLRSTNDLGVQTESAPVVVS